jgi:hypothetical protein
MISREGRRAPWRTTVRRAHNVLALACLLFAVPAGALTAPAAWSVDVLASDTRSSQSGRRDEACALIAGPAKEYCARETHPARAPRWQTPDPGAWLLVAPAAALLAVAALRRRGRPRRP